MHRELADLVGRSRSNIAMFSNDFRKPPPELVALLNLLRAGKITKADIEAALRKR
jgi:hypothetical protein